MKNYRCFYKNQSIDVQAEPSYSAQTKTAKMLKVKKAYDVTVMLLDVAHSTSVVG